MEKFNYVISDSVGIHARPAGKLVKLANSFNSTITMHKGEKFVDCRRLFGIMGLGVKCGDEITVKIEGSDESNALQEIKQFFNENL